MKTAKQLELFVGAADDAQVHALGLLGWKDPVWTTRISIPLCGGSNLLLRLIDIRALHEMVRRADPESPAPAAGAES
jgi:hypothetical protein